MKKNKKSTALISVLIATSVLLTPSIQAKLFKSRKEATWEELFTMKAVGLTGCCFRVNPYTWAYTPSFAKEFAMPDKWVDESLIGIEAVAYKYEANTAAQCGIRNNPELCDMSRACVFDLFIDNKIQIPWANQGSQGFRSVTTESALTYLKNAPREKLISNARFYFYQDEPSKKHVLSGPLTVLQFDSRSLEHLTHIRVSGSCAITRYEKDFKFVILSPEQKAMKSRKDIINPIHTMKIPSSFMKRVVNRRLDEFPGYEFERKLKLKTKR